MSKQLENLTKEARSLIQRAFKTYHPVYGFSTTSCQVYDTAWVAMISKQVDGEKQWLFPNSFQYLLKMQADDGSWGGHPRSKTVGVLDTAAALLALLRHIKEPLQLQDISSVEIRRRIDRATVSLRSQLTAWDDIMTTNHIGVEMIIPALLMYLESEEGDLTFEFESKKMLMSMHEAKLAHFSPESLYQARPSSALHSLEAFIPKLDFDKIRHHLFRGSMLASPSSTAAYLMHASSWDDEAEAYLRHVAIAGAGHGDGGIPGTHPTAYFEFNWVLSTLLQAGFSRSDLECNELLSIIQIIVNGFEADHGVIGFGKSSTASSAVMRRTMLTKLAPRAIDVDDTAKGLLTLSLLHMNKHVSPSPMIKIFEAEDHFRTFAGERDPSFTSNCHVLLALLHQPDRAGYLPQIKKTASFLWRSWWGHDGPIKDKWHLSHLYPTMLLVQAFTDLICQAESGNFCDMLDPELLSKASICLFQACLRTMLEQETNGSWNGQPEETSYAILILVEAMRLVFFKELQPQVKSAISRGRGFLESNDWKSPDHNWTSKTAYGATFVAEAYLLAAAKVSSDPIGEDAAYVGHSLNLSRLSSHLDVYMQTIRQTRFFSSMAVWEIHASLIESALFIPLLSAQRSKVYDRDSMDVSDDRYLALIPFTWIWCSNRSRTFVSTSLLFDMMLLSMLGYQTDEFIEAVVAPLFVKSTAELHNFMDWIVDTDVARRAPTDRLRGSNSGSVPTPGKADRIEGYGLYDADIVADVFQPESIADSDALARSLERIKAPLQRFVHHVLGHEGVLGASLQDQLTLRHELRAFLRAHATQVNDNAKLALRAAPPIDRAGRHHSGRSFFSWVRTTAADHVACAYSFAFMCCLISASIGDGHCAFTTAKENYLVQAAARHMATMCRMCNDFGSIDRDLAEGNMNSLNFDEFVGTPSLMEKKQALAELAEYEHHCLLHTMAQLEEEALRSTKPPNLPGDFNKRKVEMVRFFADVTDFYDQLYLVRDLSSTLRSDKTERSGGSE